MNSLLAIFLIITLGYFLGSVSVKGLSLGTSSRSCSDISALRYPPS